MVIARATRSNGGELLILGLSRMNLQRIIDGKPLHVRREVHGDGIPEGWEIVVFTGENEQAMQKMFVKEGLIGPDTKVNIDPRLTS